MRMIPLQSSNLAGIAMDPDNNQLVVQFTNGRFYRYYGVPPEVILSILFDPQSQGKAFDQKIRNGVYPYDKVSPEEINLHV